MSTLAIKVENLSKQYRIGAREAYKTFRETLIDSAGAPFRRLKNIGRPTLKEEIIWALKDVSFEVKQGDVLGVIGKNGAGKTTLLKIFSRITEPTKGRVTLKGRVASLLEVGTGFHPELTGKENIYLNGAILGMKSYEISKKFDEIVAFAEIEKFLDTPVKRYSSGMYMRLAFAVAAHLEPEILLVDEVLAVGDAAFQKKCMGKMGDVAKEGRTVLFVSHNMSAVRSLCKWVFLLESGNIIMKGNPEEVISEYLCDKTTEIGERVWFNGIDAPGDSDLWVRAIRMRNSKQIVSALINDHEDMYIDIEYHILRPLRDIRLGFQLLSSDGNTVLTSGDGDNENGAIMRKPGLYLSRCRIPKYFLNSGTYIIKLFGHIPGIRSLIKNEVLLPFTIIQATEIGGYGRSPGYIRTLFNWQVSKIDSIDDNPGS